MVDLSFLKEFTKNNSKKMKRYIEMYLSMAPDTFEKMNQSIQGEDWDQLRVYAHSLKPQADYMGIPELKAVLMEIENGAPTKNGELLSELYEKAHDIYLQSESVLEDFTNSLE
jgi:HPt (histidine-containing phosphotransfer) domain-containing protein